MNLSKKPRVCIPAAVLATLSLLAFFCNAQAAVPDLKPGDGPQAFDQVKFWTLHRLGTREYAAVDEALAKYADLNQRTLDGRSMLFGVDLAIDEYAKKHALDNNALPAIQAYRKKSPNSIAGALVEAAIWRAAAWSARGPGYASSVSDEGWKLFKERLNKAEAVMQSSRSYASKSPIWHTMRLDNALELGKSDAEIEAMFRESVALFPEYERLYFDFMRGHLPQWGGSEQQQFKVAESISNGGKSDADAIRYARLMWFISQNPDPQDNVDIFQKGAKWPLMKRGFKLLHKRYPHSEWNASNFLGFACTVNDKEAYAEWRPSVSDAEKYAMEANLDIPGCDIKFRPMSDIQWRYERLTETLHTPISDIIRGCGGEEARLIPGFRAYMAQRELVDKFEKEQRPAELMRHRQTLEELRQINPRDGKAICEGMGYKF